MIDEGERVRDLEEEPEGDEEPSNDNLPIRQYLDKHIMPSLVEALDKLTAEKTLNDPIKDPILPQDDHRTGLTVDRYRYGEITSQS